MAEDLELSLATVSNFLNGKSVDYLNFIELCQRLRLEWKAVADFDSNGNDSTTVVENLQPEEVSAEPFPDQLEAEDFIEVTIACNLYRQYFCDRLLGGAVKRS